MAATKRPMTASHMNRRPIMQSSTVDREMSEFGRDVVVLTATSFFPELSKVSKVIQHLAEW